LREGDPTISAGRIQAASALVLADQAAAPIQKKLHRGGAEGTE